MKHKVAPAGSGKFPGMNTYAGRTAYRERRGGGAARIVSAIAYAIALLIVVGILLVVLNANQSNDIVNFFTDVAKFFATPFKNLFSLDDHDAQVALNWGIAAAFYLVVGKLIARLLAR